MSVIHVEIDNGVATVTLDAPATRNALNPAASVELIEACERIDADPSVGVAVVRGANGTFCSGAERDVLARVGEDPAEAGRFSDLGAVYDAFVRVGSLAVPTISVIRGAAVGAGVNLMLATDVRIVANDARIIAGFTRIGLHPGGGHFTLLDRLAGREVAAAIGLFGAEVSGARAAELGLAWQAADDDAVDAIADELAAGAAKDPHLSRRVVGTFRRELETPGVSWLAALEIERGAQLWSLRRRHGAG